MELTPAVFTAFTIGAVHALEPGHGKSAMVGALFGSKRPFKDPLTMGASTAIGHTLGVLIFASLSFLFAHNVAEGILRQALELSVSIGLISLGIKGLLSSRKEETHEHHGHGCCSKHQSAPNLKSVSFLIGLIPCPTVIILSMSAIAISNFSTLLTLAIAFGLGVAISLTSVGWLITASFSKLSVNRVGTITKYAPTISSLAYCLAGCIVLFHLVSGHAH